MIRSIFKTLKIVASALSVICILMTPPAVAQRTVAQREGKVFINPQISPDGDFIAFGTDDGNELWVVRSDGYALRMISDKPGSGVFKQWSPDSKWLLYSERSGNTSASYNLWITEASTWNISKIRVPPQQTTQVHWYGSDQLLVRVLSENKIYNSGIRLKRGHKSKPFVYVEPKKIVIQYPDGTPFRVIKPVLGADYVNPQLSPDGNKIVFSTDRGELYIYDIRTLNLTDLGKGESARWSPNGLKIVYSMIEDNGFRILSSDLYVFSPNGRNKTRLTQTSLVLEMNPVFSPNSRTVIYDTESLGEIRALNTR